MIDKAERTDGTFSRSDFVFDPESNLYVCPGGKELRKYHRTFAKPRDVYGFTNIQFSMGSTTQGEVWTVMGAQGTGVMTAFTDLGVAFDQIADEGLPHTLPDGFNDFLYTRAPADNGMNDGHNCGDGCGGNVLLASFTG